MGTDELIGIGLGGAAAIGQAMYGQSQAQQNQQQQVQDQRELMELASNLNYQNWIKTNYAAQVEQMKKAGLNVGMIYKNGGGGGTLGGASTGSASKADTIPMDISNAITQNRAIESQIKLNEAQAKKLEVEANKTAGVDTDLVKTQIESNNITNAFNTENFETALNKAKAELNNVNANTEKALTEGILNRIDAITRQWENTEKVINTIANTNKMNAEVKQNWEKIKQGWKDLELKNRGLDIEQQKTNIQKFGAETQRNYPSLMNVTGNVINDGLKAIYKLFGLDKENTPTTTKIE